MIKLIGEWTGTKVLLPSSLPNPEFSPKSALSISSVAKGNFLALSYFWYSWSHEQFE
ncbi:MAG: hypothetical protein ACR2NN_17165 [Bryobacteraceae bacterium]